jgi:hypothetical protein
LRSLLIYGDATGCYSSRKIERATDDSLAFRFIAANSHPDHDTLSIFRRRFAKAFEGAFVQVLQVARENQLSRFGTVSLDGTKIHANAGCHSALSYGHAEAIEAHLKGEVQELLALAEEADAANSPDGMSLPEEINRTEQLLADAGDFSEAIVTACESTGIEPAIAIKRDEHHPHWSEHFESPEAPPAEAPPLERMAHRLKTPKGRATYALRKQTVEPVFGILKSVMGFRQFLTRGLDNVQNEWILVCLALNFKRMAVLRPQ